MLQMPSMMFRGSLVLQCGEHVPERSPDVAKGHLMRTGTPGPEQWNQRWIQPLASALIPASGAE